MDGEQPSHVKTSVSNGENSVRSGKGYGGRGGFDRGRGGFVRGRGGYDRERGGFGRGRGGLDRGRGGFERGRGGFGRGRGGFERGRGGFERGRGGFERGRGGFGRGRGFERGRGGFERGRGGFGRGRGSFERGRGGFGRGRTLDSKGNFVTTDIGRDGRSRTFNEQRDGFGREGGDRGRGGSEFGSGFSRHRARAIPQFTNIVMSPDFVQGNVQEFKDYPGWNRDAILPLLDIIEDCGEEINWNRVANDTRQDSEECRKIWEKLVSDVKPRTFRSTINMVKVLLIRGVKREELIKLEVSSPKSPADTWLENMEYSQGSKKFRGFPAFVKATCKDELYKKRMKSNVAYFNYYKENLEEFSKICSLQTAIRSTVR